jgi:hypothetical protein
VDGTHGGRGRGRRRDRRAEGGRGRQESSFGCPRAGRPGPLYYPHNDPHAVAVSSPRCVAALRCSYFTLYSSYLLYSPSSTQPPPRPGTQPPPCLAPSVSWYLGGDKTGDKTARHPSLPWDVTHPAAHVAIRVRPVPSPARGRSTSSGSGRTARRPISLGGPVPRAGEA